MKGFVLVLLSALRVVYYQVMSPEQKKTLEAVKEWLRIRVAHEARLDEATKAVLRQLIPDIDHSALLRRLLSGGEALEQAPPRAYSYPWYSLVEEGKAVGGFEVFFMPEGMGIDADGRNPMMVVIAQSPWVILGGVQDQGWLVEYPETGLRCLLSYTRAEREQEWTHNPTDWKAFNKLPQEQQEHIKELWWEHNAWSLEVIPAKK